MNQKYYFNFWKILSVALFSLFFNVSVAYTSSGRATVQCSYNECVQIALRNNDQILAAQHDVDVSKGKQYQSHPRGIPVVNYEHRLAPVPKNVDDAADSFFDGEISVFNSFKLEFGTPITSFGKIQTVQELADIGVEASYLQKYKLQDEIAFNVYQTYQGILLASELKSLANQALDAIGNKISELEKEKIIDQLQILKLKVALYEIERKLEAVCKKEALAYSALKLQMGLEEDVPLHIRSEALVPVNYRLKSLDYYLGAAREYMPEYKLLSSGIDAKEKKLRLEQLSYRPNLGVGGFVDVGRAPDIRGAEDESTFTNPFNYTKAGIGLQLKGEFDYVKHTGKVREAKADLLKSIFQKRAAVRGLELDIHKSFLEVKEAQTLMNKADEEKKAARQMVFLTKSNLDIGIGDKKEYLDALQSYLIFQGRGYEAIYNYNVAVSSLKKKIGQLYENIIKENQ